MKVDIIGVPGVASAIEDCRYYKFKIYENKPGDNTPCVWDGSACTSHSEASGYFTRWSGLVLDTNPNNTKVYYILLSNFGTIQRGRARKNPLPDEPIIFSFMLQSPYGDHIQGSRTEAQREYPEYTPSVPVPGGSGISREQMDTLLELERLKVENEQLRTSILEEEGEDDDMQDGDILNDMFSGDQQSPVMQALGEIITSFAKNLTASKDPKILALEAIEKASPQAGELLIKLGEIAVNNPAQIQQFISSILSTLTGSNEAPKP